MLTGERVVLRAIEREDLPNYVRWFSDPEVTAWIGRHLPPSMAEEERWYQNSILTPRPEKLSFAIDFDGKHVGGCALDRIDQRQRSGAVGICIGEKAVWDQGLGTDAIRLLLRYGFEELNLHRIELRVATENRRAIRCYEKCGFRHEGVLRDGFFSRGRYHDWVLMAVLEDDWRAAQGRA